MSYPDPPWPALPPAAAWADTREALHRWLQLLGKTALALRPMLNQWWQVALTPTPQGLSTGPLPCAGGLCEVQLDLAAGRLRLLGGPAGPVAELPLQTESVADFYRRYRALLQAAGVAVKIWPVPRELPDAVPFPQDTRPRTYDPAAAAAYWQALLRVQPVLEEFRGRFTGKSSPVHLFWGGFDLSVARYSGRPAPAHGPVPNLGQRVVNLAYNEEVYEVGFWPGGDGQEAGFFAYVYPEPAGFAQAPAGPAARYDAPRGEFTLPYEAVRASPDPARTLRDFLQATYEAAATLARWDRPALERVAW